MNACCAAICRTDAELCTGTHCSGGLTLLSRNAHSSPNANPAAGGLIFSAARSRSSLSCHKMIAEEEEKARPSLYVTPTRAQLIREEDDGEEESQLAAAAAARRRRARRRRARRRRARRPPPPNLFPVNLSFSPPSDAAAAVNAKKKKSCACLCLFVCARACVRDVTGFVPQCASKVPPEDVRPPLCPSRYWDSPPVVMSPVHLHQDVQWRQLIYLHSSVDSSTVD